MTVDDMERNLKNEGFIVCRIPTGTCDHFDVFTKDGRRSSFSICGTTIVIEESGHQSVEVMLRGLAQQNGITKPT